MDRTELLRRVKALLQEAFGPRLKGVILYGSEARGQADPDSDIDLLVLLDGPVNWWDDCGTCINALYPLVLEMDGRPIHAEPVSVSDYEAQVWPLYQNARKEGIRA
jgi:predicted nucleotidyltransferase